MSEVYVVWAEDAEKAQARLEVISDGGTYRVLRRGDFELIQAEDVDSGEFLDSGGERYCIVFQLG